MKGKILLFGAAFILGMGVETSSASPLFLLTIDDSDLSAVTITATGADSGVNDSSRVANDGVDLLGFFNQDQRVGGSVVNSTLQGGGLTLSYNTTTADDESTSGGDFLDFNLYYEGFSGDTDPETFSTTQPAFTGSMTVDFSSLGIDPSVFPTAGSQGQILSGYSDNPGTVIGEWQVAAVPEPTAASLLLLGSAAGLIFWRRRARENTAVRG